ncbi:lamin tail domain-containing protein [Patescibacteria group bacterium]|nr:lamin tail domain-containing protein [Patescibacteria group bacterium]
MKSKILMAFFIAILLILGGLTIHLKAQEIPPVVFTEIMYDLDGSDSGKEWVEIYNRGSVAVEIIEGSGSNSWRFNDGSNHTLSLYQGDLVLEPEEVAILAADAETFLQEHADFVGTIIDTVMSLNNSGDTISLSNDGGQTFFTEVAYESLWGASGNGYALEKIDPQLGDEQSNWQESAELGGSPGLISQGGAPPDNNPPVAEAGQDQTVLIDELVVFNGSASYDPDNDPLTYDWDFGDQASGQGITASHIYSATGTFIVTLEVSDGQLQDYDTLQVIVEGDTSTTTEPGSSENQPPIAEAGEDQTVYLGDTISFNGANSYDPDNDQLTYNWDFGDNQTASGANVTHQYSEAESYTVTLTVSDGELEDQDSLIVEVLDNSPASGPSSGGGAGENQSPTGYSDKIIINEILPNPVGPDSAEFIELKNISYEVIDLLGWQLQDNSSKVYSIEEGDFSSTEIAAGGYFVITKDISGISLNNSGGDKVILYQPDGNQLEVVEYASSALEGKAYARKDSGEWVWTAEPTAGSQNSFIANQPPEAKFTVSSAEFYIDDEAEFDGSASADPDGGEITYHWDFGDGSYGDEVKEAHIYETGGTFNIILTVTDSAGLSDASTKQVIIKMPGEIIISSSTQSSMPGDYSSITINEFLVNPSGSDDFEWIEIFNNSSEPVDLSDLQLDDAEGGSKPYQLSALAIEPFSYLVVNRADSKIALNNSSDSVRLLTVDGQIIQEVIYDGAKEGQSYSYNQILNDWFWSDQPTPGAENQLPFFGNLGIAANAEENQFQQIFYQILEIKDLDKGAEVSTRGIVTVIPGILGKNIFYISEIDLAGQSVFLSTGIEVYSSRAEFPGMSVGDVIEFSGKVSETKGKKRINLQKDSQINIIDHWELPQPELIGTGEITNDLIGAIIKVSGTLVEKKSSNYYLDDGSGELKMYLNKTTGIPKLDVEVGYMIEVSGILDLTDSGYRLLPRFPGDIIIGQVLGEAELAELSDEVISLKAEDQKNKIMKYLLFGGGGIIVILISLLIRWKLLRKKI